MPLTVDEMLAREEIRALAAQYIVGVDTQDLEKFVGVFAEDAVMESSPFRLEGRAAISEVLASSWAADNNPWTDESNPHVPLFARHHITTAEIILDGPDTARGLIYYLMLTDLGPDHCGFYNDVYRRTAEGWRIAYRAIWMDWCREDSIFVPDLSKRMIDDKGSCGPLLPSGDLVPSPFKIRAPA